MKPGFHWIKFIDEAEPTILEWKKSGRGSLTGEAFCYSFEGMVSSAEYLGPVQKPSL